MFVISVYAQGIMSYEAYESDSKIFFRGISLNIDEPVVTINGKTYVPLRDAAEYYGFEVEWDSDTGNIYLEEKFNPAEMREKFSELFEVELPETAEILNCSCHEYYNFGEKGVEETSEENCYKAKILLDKNAMETFKQALNESELYYDSRADSNSDAFLLNLSKRYHWWDLSEIEDTEICYHAFKAGAVAKTRNIYMYVTEAAEKQYYLYVSI